MKAVVNCACAILTVKFHCVTHLDGKVPVNDHALAVAALGVSGVGGDPAVVRALPAEGEGRTLAAAVLVPGLARPSIQYSM